MIKKAIIVSVIVLFTFIYNMFFPKIFVVGKYIGKVNSSFGANGVNDGEKLELFYDNSFKSDSWGSGTFRLKYGIDGTRIVFKFNGEVVSTYFYRSFLFGKPKIVIFRDFGSAFEKIY
jgi:hypothetical protein